MNCDRCNKDGARPYKYTEKGVLKTVFLCPGCYAASGAFSSAENVRCIRCGTTLHRVKNTGYLGCADCFKYFGDDLLPLLDAYQAGAISRPDEKRKFIKIIKLQEEYDDLSSAVAPDEVAARAIARRLGVIREELERSGVIVDE